ncbi:MAG TPA: hypothetical protein DCZ94_06725 [Lentisphaeria bacterium]|nr:MAG: hypothetical protein A2X48_10665 [Lentisphaerae bacterium GWF2_49_21]HBC86629.1 hypothetical protein [Lentisphaeria bacterium]
MKIILSIALAIACLGCNEPNPQNGDLDANAAKAALLDLMRSQTSPFEGADSTRFEKIGVAEEGEGKLRWGAFTIDLVQKTYSADVVADTAFWSYQGRFLVDPSGRWKAENFSKRHGSK